MSIATSCYVRDTALKFAQQGVDLTKAMLANTTKANYNPFFSTSKINETDLATIEVSLNLNLNIFTQRKL